jgi:DNA mismatch repair protein MSH5
VRACFLFRSTSPSDLGEDGAGLFCGVLKHLLARGSRCPKVLVATHFHDVFTDELLDVDHWPITFCHMQVMFTGANPTSTTDGSDYDMTSQTRESVPPGPGKEKITYLYRYVDFLPQTG